MLPSRMLSMVLIALGCVSIASAAPKTVTKAPPKITLLDAGAAPRKPLRLKFTKGDTQTVEMSMAQSQKVVVDGEPLPSVSVPQTIVTLELHVESVRLDGEATISMRVVAAHADADAKGADPALIAMLDDALVPMTQMTGTFTLTSQGVYRSMTMQLPDDLPPGMDKMMDSFSQSMDQMSNPFPIERVGVGASWSVVSEVDMLGLHAVATRDFELAAIDNDTLTLNMTGEIHLAPGEHKNMPNLPEGMAAKYDSFAASMHGVQTLDLHDSMPRSGKMSASMKFVMSFTDAGVESKVDAQGETVVTMETPTPMVEETPVNESK